MDHSENDKQLQPITHAKKKPELGSGKSRETRRNKIGGITICLVTKQHSKKHNKQTTIDKIKQF